MKHIQRYNQLIAITGGIASGKSFMLRCFRSLGYLTYSFDQIVNDLYKIDQPIYDALKNVFHDCLNEIGIDKQLIAKKVFNDKTALLNLESVVHPIIRSYFIEFCKQVRSMTARTIIAEIPLLFETGNPDMFDIIISSICPISIRKKRALARPNMTIEKFNSIISRQSTDNYRINNSNIIIESKDSFSYTFKQIKYLLKYDNKRDCT